MDEKNKKKLITGLVIIFMVALIIFSYYFLVNDIDNDNNNDDTENGIEWKHSEGTDFGIEIVAENLNNPWGMDFMPGNSEIIVTERTGQLNIINRNSGEVKNIEGVPEVYTQGQGGLLDVALHPDFEQENWVYLTYSASNEDGKSSTHLGRGKLNSDELKLENFEELYVTQPYLDSDGHYGSRIAFGADGMIYMTVGDRQDKNFGPEHVSQNLSNELGTTLRLEKDGSIPSDNPFINSADAVDSIFSYGHRNSQGMTVHPKTGDIWQSEHGEQDGDEINIVEKGGNHGWPIAHYGCTYGTGAPIGDLPHENDETVNPVYFWECNSGGFPPAGMTFYYGNAFPDWEGNLFVGNLAGQYLGRFEVNGKEVEEKEPLLAELGMRIRDVKISPDKGTIYVLTDDWNGKILRLIPSNN